VAQLFQKPVDPARLSKTVERILSRRGLNVSPLAVGEHHTQYSAEDLMRKTINMAAVNVKLGKGRPFAAIVADKDGMILGEGTNRHASRYDPIAHAEVMAIRQAAEKSDSKDLSDCTLYCSSMPTKIGAALIESVDLAHVYYGLSHEDAGMSEDVAKPPPYEQLCKDEALAMYRSNTTQSRK
jgi:tRNA(Arg) A34 adenosine deaminase TadA